MFNFGGSASSRNWTQDQTTTPILSNQWLGAYDSAAGNMGINGANPSQQTALDFYNWALSNPNYVSGPLLNQAQATSSRNNDVILDSWKTEAAHAQELGDVNWNGLAPIFTNPTPQLTDFNGSSAGPLVNPNSGAAMASPYSLLYSTAVIDPSLAAYDYGTDRAFSALDARTAAGGAFNNSRSGLAYSDLAAQRDMGRGQLAAGLLNQGAQTAFSLGQQDANRDLNAQSTNASNILNNNQFNANLLNNRQQFNVGAQFQDDAQRLQASQQWADSVMNRQKIAEDFLDRRLNVNQQDLTNLNSAIMARRDVDSDAAQHLLSGGGLTQDQLFQLLQLAQAANGSYTHTTGQESSKSVNAGFSLI